MRPITLIALAIAISVAIAVTVNIFVLSPPPAAPSADEPAAVSSDIYNGPPPECAAIQSRIDAAGRPGWDGLDPALQAEISQWSQCHFVGDGQRF